MINDWAEESDRIFGFSVRFHLKSSFQESDNSSLHFDANDVSEESRRRAVASKIASKVYSDIVIPVIQTELDQGEVFAEVRQIFRSVILANWFRKLVLKDARMSQKFKDALNSNKTDFLTMTKFSHTSNLGHETKPLVDKISSVDPAFRVPGNAEFYENYCALFRRGLYRCKNRK